MIIFLSLLSVFLLFIFVEINYKGKSSQYHITPTIDPYEITDRNNLLTLPKHMELPGIEVVFPYVIAFREESLAKQIPIEQTVENLNYLNNKTHNNQLKEQLTRQIFEESLPLQNNIIYSEIQNFLSEKEIFNLVEIINYLESLIQWMPKQLPIRIMFELANIVYNSIPLMQLLPPLKEKVVYPQDIIYRSSLFMLIVQQYNSRRAIYNDTDKVYLFHIYDYNSGLSLLKPVEEIVSVKNLKEISGQDIFGNKDLEFSLDILPGSSVDLIKEERVGIMNLEERIDLENLTDRSNVWESTVNISAKNPVYKSNNTKAVEIKVDSNQNVTVYKGYQPTTIMPHEISVDKLNNASFQEHIYSYPLYRPQQFFDLINRNFGQI